jgi:hypothetical protein
MAEHGDAKLSNLLVTLADYPQARSASVYNRCKAVYERSIRGEDYVRGEAKSSRRRYT